MKKLLLLSICLLALAANALSQSNDKTPERQALIAKACGTESVDYDAETKKGSTPDARSSRR